jgi:Ca2+-binding RTX toxin-like protein
MSQGSVITGTVNTGETLTGTIGEDTIKGLAGNDSLLGGLGNDTLIGGSGNDTVDGGSGYNTYIVTGGADAFYWTVNASGDVLLTDSVTDPADPVDGSNEGVDTLRNIQAIQYVRPDGTVESTFVVDDFGNAPDAGNYQIQYGGWVNGRANFYGDLDYFKLQTTAGQKVVLSSGDGSSYGYLHQGGYNIQGNDSYINSGSDRVLNLTSTGLQDLYFRSEQLSSSSPMTSKGYSFILRRELDGTDGNDALVAGTDYEQLVGGVGNDTLTGSDRSDYLDGGADNDLLTGGKGNDELDGGAGTANVAVFTGNRANYSATWLGGNLSLRISDNVAGRDGTDTLVNVQVLRFADGDVTLDRESNTPVQTAVALGTAMTGSLPITRSDDANMVDIDYFQQKFTADISTNTALRISLQASGGSSYYGSIAFQFYQTGSIDALTFNNLGSTGTISQFGGYLSPGSQQSWIVSPKQWGSGSEFQSMAQRADLKVWGWFTNGTSAQLGDLAGYTIKVDRVLFGTTGADTIIGDGLSGYIDARDGTDVVTGSSIDEQIIGGLGDDTLSGGGGNDILTESAGRNSLSGGDGDDLIDLSASASPTSTVDGGAGIDTLKIASDTNWAGLSVTGVEVLDGNGGRTALTPQQVATLGFTTSQNITFRLDPYLASGGSLDASGLAGNLNLRGTNQSDMLTGNAGNNTIYLTSDEAVGAGSGVDTVHAGAGDDTIVWSTRQYQQSSQFFSGADAITKTYKIKGEIDGGDGTDTLTLSFGTNYMYHAWGGDTWYQANTPAWKVDLTELTLSGIEQLSVSGYDVNRFWAYPSEFILTATQLASLSSTSGLRALSIVGGGVVDLVHLAAIGVTTWRTGDALAYQIIGTVNGDTLTLGAGAINADLGAGNDEFVIESKALVTDTLSGGEGFDTLTIRGSDVDLSGAVLSGIEAIKVSAQLLSMTGSQWSALGSLVQRVSGASTGYILSINEPGITTLVADSPYVGLTGSSGDDRLIGNAGNNILVGGVGNDELSGNAGNDRLVTGTGIDTLFGGDGDDTLVITDKTVVRDQLDGGSGVDTLQVSDGQNLTAATLSGLEVLSGSGAVALTPEQLAGFQSVRGVMVQLTGNATTFSLGSTQLTNGGGVMLPQADSTLTATSGILGSSGDNIIGGGAGADIIYGGRGSDHLDGGAGSDTLIGGSGVDTLLGGAGDDLFRVEASELATSSMTVYSDIMDGGLGSDTLELNVGGDSSSYQINAGAISNIQRLVVT